MTMEVLLDLRLLMEELDTPRILIIVPVGAIGYGEPASVRMGVLSLMQLLIRMNSLVIISDWSLILKEIHEVGSGYITAPLFRTIDPTGRRWNWNWNGQNLN